MRTLLGDARHVFRAIRQAPAFHTLVIGILGLGIAASVAVFSLVDGVLLRPLPYRHPERLVSIETIAIKPPYESNGSFSYSDFEQLRAQVRSLDIEAMYRNGWSRVTLPHDGVQERARGAFVSPGFFALFGREPILGRAFTAEENDHAERVVLLGERLAERRFGSAAAALGSDIQIGESRWRIVGVMPADFRVPFLDSQLWAPIRSHPEWNDQSEPNSRQEAARWDLMGRLKPGAGRSAAQAEVDAVYSRLAQAAPKFHNDRALVLSLSEHFTGAVRRPLAILSAAVALLLLIACANVGNLLLARSAGRRQEFAIRAALGADAARLMGQALAETVTLCLLAGVLASALAVPLVGILKSMAPGDTPRLGQVGVDFRVLFFAASVSLALGVCLGLASMWRSARRNSFDRVGLASRGASAGRETRRLKNVLVAAEFALAMVLLTGAALLVRSFAAVLSVDLGFRPERVLTLSVQLPDRLPVRQRADFFREAVARLRRIPGVEAAGAANYLFTGVSRTHALREVEGRPAEPVEKWGALEWAQVSGDYFQAMGIPLLRGRFFDERDGPDAPPVAIVNETLARRYWPGDDPVGKRFKGMDPRGPGGGKNDDWLTVVGVVKDMRSGGRERPPFAQVYEVQAQRGEDTNAFVVRGAGDPLRLAAEVRAAIRAADRDANVSRLSTVEQLLDEDQMGRRFETWLVGVFSTLSLALAALGVFGVMHFAVIARTREIGVRIAVGARGGDILALVIRDGAMLACVGIAAGAFASAWTSEALAGMLFGVKSTDPASFAMAAGILATVAVAASYLPARRAARLDPVAALREQ
jgi:putative ABC transport system permease protein